MGTTFQEIYCLNSTVSDDRRLSLLPISKKYAVLYDYLKFGISFESFYRKCYQNIQLKTPYSSTVYTFEADGVGRTYTLSPQPSDNVAIDVYYIDAYGKDVTVSDFTYENYEVTTTEVFPAGVNLQISAYIIGEFEEDLDLDVQDILATAMLIPYKKYYQNRAENMQQRIASDGVTVYSPANFKKELSAELKQEITDLRRKIQTYMLSADPNNLKGWGGGF